MRSYRDTIRLLLGFVAKDNKTKITKLTVDDLTFERIVGFLRYLEDERHNHVRTRNQRLAAVHTLFDYIAAREPEMLGVCQRVAAIPMKRAAPAETHFLERDEIEALFRTPAAPRPARPARQDPAPVPLQHRRPRARGRRPSGRATSNSASGRSSASTAKATSGEPARCGARQRTSSSSSSTSTAMPDTPTTPVFVSTTGEPLTRFGIYKIVRRHAGHLDDARTDRRVSPHIFRHTAAVHLLEAGVEVNVIRGWLGHADLTTTNRYAEINTRAKIEALRNTEPPAASAGRRPRAVWRDDETLLAWLASL